MNRSFDKVRNVRKTRCPRRSSAGVCRGTELLAEHRAHRKDDKEDVSHTHSGSLENWVFLVEVELIA
jgi:hypothetical protein